MRTRLVVSALAVVVLLVAGTLWYRLSGNEHTPTAALVEPDSPQVAQAEALRRAAGSTVRDVTLTAAPTQVRFGTLTVRTWAFNGHVPGPTIHVRAGDVVRARVLNHLPEPLTVHWHGLALRNDMDGVPDVTQKAIQPGGSFVYEFTAAQPGTYWYHPHTGTQLDRGLYGAFIVDDPAQTTTRRDIPLMLDDWIDGTGETPDQVLEKLKSGGAQMSGMDHGGMHHGSMGSTSTSPDSPLGTDTADVGYPLYVINGRTQPVYAVRPGEKVRLRLINAASSTPFRVAFGGGSMTVVATDGYPVQSVQTDALLIGMGERYDVVVTVPGSGAFPVVAAVEGKQQQAMAVLRVGNAALPMLEDRPAQLDGRLLTLDDLHATTKVALPDSAPKRTYRVDLTGDMMAYNWGLDAPKRDGATLAVTVGERVRIVLVNRTTMWHPIHLHGHTFQVVTGNGVGPRKDTVIVPPSGTVTIDVLADNPGQWMLHCHTTYHAEVGMMTTLSYLS